MYLRALSIDGDQTIKGVDVDLDVGFSDIFDNLNGALTFHLEGLPMQRWGFLSDLNYIVLEMDDGPVDIDFTETQLELAGFYRFTRGPMLLMAWADCVTRRWMQNWSCPDRCPMLTSARIGLTLIWVCDGSGGLLRSGGPI
jgi:hypothetical protein